MKELNQIKSDDCEEFYQQGRDKDWFITVEENNVKNDLVMLRRHLPNPMPNAILDIGSGPAIYLNELAKNIYASSWHACDISKTALSKVPEGIHTNIWDIRNPAPLPIKILNPFLTIIRETLYYVPGDWKAAAQNVADIVLSGNYLISSDALIRFQRREIWSKIGFELVDRITYPMLLKTGGYIKGRNLKVLLYKKR